MTFKRGRLVQLAIATACVAHAVPADDGMAGSDGLTVLLDYDAAARVDLRVIGEDNSQSGVSVTDATFAGVGGGRETEAYVVRPKTWNGPLAGVLFVHWFEPGHPTSNRTQFLGEARALATRGTVSLLVSTFWSDPERYRARTWQTDFENSVNQARELRRALDVLLAQPGVDPARIGYIGHDYGAMFGMLTAAVDARPQACAFIAGAARFPDWYLFGSSTGRPEGDDLARFRAEFARIDPVRVIGQIKAPIFFQYGESDRYTPRANFTELYLAAGPNARIATYPSDHDMAHETIRRDRIDWLAAQLGLAH